MARSDAPKLLRAALQRRALGNPLGWYRLQESWTALTIKALWDFTIPGKGLHEAIVDLVLWRAPQHERDQRIWIPSIELTQPLTQDTNTYTHKGTTRLRRAPAEKDHPSDANQPEEWEKATRPNRYTALVATGLHTPDDDLPPHLQTTSGSSRRSGVQSSSAGTIT